MRGPYLVACAAVGVLLFVCSPAVAVPPLDGWPGSPRSDPTLDASVQPLPTLVPPPNDAFAAAAVAPSIPFSATQSTVEATTAVDDPSCLDNDGSVWYAFTPSVSSPLTASTFGSDYVTTLSAYTGTQGALTQLACSDGARWGGRSQVRLSVTAGTTYYFMAAGVVGFCCGNLVFTLDAAPLPLVPLRTTPAQEVVPSGDAGHLAWSQYPRRGTAFTSLYMQTPGGPRVRVNRTGTHGWSGGFDGDTFVYQEARGRQSNLQLYDVPTGIRSAPQAGVNTLAWEWRPTMSGDQLLFGRSLVSQRIDQVLLRNLTTGSTRILDRIRWRNGFNWPGQVNGNFAVWSRCDRNCNVFIRDIAAATTTKIGNPGRQQYAPSVTSDGTMYFVRSARACGAFVQLVRRPPGGPGKVVAPLPWGQDISSTYAHENADGTTRVLLGRVRCRADARDVFSVRDP